MRRNLFPLWGYIFMLFLILLIPIQVVNMLFLTSGRQALENEIGQSTASHIQSQLDDMADQIDRIEANLVQFVVEDNASARRFLAKYNGLSKQEYWLFLREIISQMDNIVKSNPLVEELELYYPSLKLTVSSKMGVWSEDKLYLSDEFRRYSSQQPLMQSDDSLCVSYVFPLEPPLIYIKARISDKNIRDAICSLNTFNNYDVAFYSLSAERLVQNNESSISSANVLSLLNDNDFLRDDDVRIIYYGKDTSCCMVRSASLNAIICVFLPLDEIYAVPQRLQRFLLIYISAWPPILLVFTFLGLKWILRPVGNMLRACDAVSANRYDLFIPENTPIREFEDLILHFNAMIFRQGNLVNTILKQEIYAQKSELKHLQAQINPHFLYNSFFLLRHMISNEENESAQRLCDYLGGYFRYITDSTQQKATLKEEFEHALTYIQIQHMRFPNRFSLDIENIPTELEMLRVPRLIMQPIFENAIVHGFRTMSSGAVFHMESRVDKNLVVISFEDNGNELTDEILAHISEGFFRTENDGEVTGLSNIHRRLQLEFGPSAGLTAQRSMMGGLKILMSIPIDSIHENAPEEQSHPGASRRLSAAPEH